MLAHWPLTKAGQLKAAHACLRGACTVHCARGRKALLAPRCCCCCCDCLRKGEERRGEERREGKKERAQINLLSSAVADGRTGWPTALAGRADDFGDDGAR